MHGSSAASTVMSTTFTPEGAQQPDSLFLIAFASRLSLQTNGSTSSPRSSFAVGESGELGELDDRRYSLFGADDEDEPSQARQPLMPVWPEELQYAEDSSTAQSASTALPTPTHCAPSVVVESCLQSPKRPKTWIGKTAKKIFVSRKMV